MQCSCLRHHVDQYQLCRGSWVYKDGKGWQKDKTFVSGLNNKVTRSTRNNKRLARMVKEAFSDLLNLPQELLDQQEKPVLISAHCSAWPNHQSVDSHQDPSLSGFTSTTVKNNCSITFISMDYTGETIYIWKSFLFSKSSKLSIFLPRDTEGHKLYVQELQLLHQPSWKFLHVLLVANIPFKLDINLQIKG